METLLWKQRVREQDLEAQAEKMSALEATTRSLFQGGHPEAQGALSRCQAMLLRYLWLRLRGCGWWAGTGIRLFPCPSPLSLGSPSLYQGLNSDARAPLSQPCGVSACYGIRQHTVSPLR